MNKKVVAILISMFTIGLLFYANIQGATSIQLALKNSKISNPHLLNTLTLDDRNVVFYESNDNLGVAVVKKDFLGWKIVDIGSGSSFNEETGLDWNFTNLSGAGANSSISLFLGIINNPQISQILVQKADQPSQNAKIIETPKGYIAYILYDQPTSPPAKIIAFSERGEELYEY